MLLLQLRRLCPGADVAGGGSGYSPALHGSPHREQRPTRWHEERRESCRLFLHQSGRAAAK